MSTMTSDELNVLHEYIDSSVHYLEFGSGESTVYASSTASIKSIDSVESSESYINENLKSNDSIKEAVLSGKLTFHIIDVGETTDWGNPKNKLKKHLWPNYSLSVFNGKSNHDLILVDGRFRVSCILNSILNSPDNCKILVHDFWNRPRYHFVTKFLNVLKKTDSLAVFEKKQVNDFRQLQAIIKKYQYFPDDKTTALKIKERLLNSIGIEVKI